MLVIKGVKKRLGNLNVLNGIDTEFNTGETIAILGSSGGGKTTFLRCLANLITPDEGSIIFHGMSLAKTRAGTVGLVSQNWDLFNNMTVQENVVYALIHVLKLSQEEAQKKAEELLSELHILGQKNAYPSQLSGGQKQRAAIARAMAMNPQVLLFDEPTSALDPVMTLQVVKLFQSFAAKKILLVMASHDLHFVQKVATRVLFLHKGVITEDAECAKFFAQPQSLPVKSFLKGAVFA